MTAAHDRGPGDAARWPAIAVMAKVPNAEAVKSRLYPALGSRLATQLYEALLLDRLDALKALGGVERLVAFTPPEARSEMARLAPLGFTLVAQRGRDLGERLDALLTELISRGHPGAIAVDSDSPTLPMAYVSDAARVLAKGMADAVLGPCDDGGYYLIGLRAPHPELFEAIPWSTEQVLSLTLERARRAGLRTHLLPPWFDVDTEADLRRLHEEMERSGTGPSRTFGLVREIFHSAGR